MCLGSTPPPGPQRSGHSQIAKPMHLRHRHLGVHQNPILTLGPLQVAGNLVQLMQPPALRVRNQ